MGAGDEGVLSLEQLFQTTYSLSTRDLGVPIYSRWGLEDEQELS
jgi:hypothetical protein